jgi:ubiquinone/menaquinone biosynthesis C-methylase UbiE
MIFKSSNLWRLPRVPEPEVMDDAGEVESYNSGAATRHLEAIDNTFVEHLLRLLPQLGQMGQRNSFAGDAGVAKCASPWALDVGTGPGQIPIRVLSRAPNLRFVGVDRSANMLRQARDNAAAAGVADRLACLLGDGCNLPFPDHRFGVVICNSVLHHARDPVALLREVFRVAARDGAVLVRDLRRPSRPLLQWHLWRHGRHYGGLMRQLFNESVRAAYTPDELRRLLDEAGVSDARVFRFRGAHIGAARPGGAGEGAVSLQRRSHSVR